MSTENLPPYTTIEPLGGALSGAGRRLPCAR